MGIHQRAISWSIWNPSQHFGFCISSCVICIECFSAELRVTRLGIQEKIITLWTSPAGLPFFLSACSAVLYLIQKMPLNQIVWGCFCPLESWFRSEANSHFKQREWAWADQYTERVLANPAPSSYEAGCWLLWSPTELFHARCTVGDLWTIVSNSIINANCGSVAWLINLIFICSIQSTGKNLASKWL